MGTKQRPGAFDCHAKALPDEPMFVLLARDPSAPDLVEKWALNRADEIQSGTRPTADWPVVEEARQCADNMRTWRMVNDGKWRHKPTLTREQLIDRLTWLASAPAGSPVPEWLSDNAWHTGIAEAAASALALIMKADDVSRDV